MEIEVCSRSQDRKEFILEVSRFFREQLNLKNSKYVLTIQTVNRLLKEHGSYGMVCRTGEQHVSMFVDSRLSLDKLVETLAHEMVHVKQIARGQLRTVVGERGRKHQQWLGRRVRCNYWNAPWELEAYRRENELRMRLVDVINRAAARQQKR